MYTCICNMRDILLYIKGLYVLNCINICIIYIYILNAIYLHVSSLYYVYLHALTTVYASTTIVICWELWHIVREVPQLLIFSFYWYYYTFMYVSLFIGADTPYYWATLPPKADVRGKHLALRKVIPWE